VARFSDPDHNGTRRRGDRFQGGGLRSDLGGLLLVYEAWTARRTSRRSIDHSKAEGSVTRVQTRELSRRWGRFEFERPSPPRIRRSLRARPPRRSRGGDRSTGGRPRERTGAFAPELRVVTRRSSCGACSDRRITFGRHARGRERSTRRCGCWSTCRFSAASSTPPRWQRRRRPPRNSRGDGARRRRRCV
jgi:hypothetical protein